MRAGRGLVSANQQAVHDRRAPRQLVGQRAQRPVMIHCVVDQVGEHLFVRRFVRRILDAVQIPAQVGIVVDFGNIVHIVIIVSVML